MPFVGPVSGPINAEMQRSVGALLACCLRLRRTAAAGTSPAFCSAVVPALLVLSTRRKVANFLRVTEEADLKQMATDVADGHALRPVGCAERARRDRLKAKQERARRERQERERRAAAEAAARAKAARRSTRAARS